MFSDNYSILFILLMLKIQHFGHLMRSANSLEKTLMLGKIEGKKVVIEDEMVGGITSSVDMSLSKLGDSEGQGSLERYHPWGHKELDTTW